MIFLEIKKKLRNHKKRSDKKNKDLNIIHVILYFSIDISKFLKWLGFRVIIFSAFNIFAVNPIIQSTKSRIIPFALNSPLKVPDSCRIDVLIGIIWNSETNFSIWALILR